MVYAILGSAFALCMAGAFVAGRMVRNGGSTADDGPGIPRGKAWETACNRPVEFGRLSLEPQQQKGGDV